MSNARWLDIAGRPPSESTIRRTLARVDAAVLDQVIGVWAWLHTRVVDGRRVIAVDGKTLRGAKDAAGHLTHLLAALDQASGAVLGQVEVGAKTNEIPPITDLLAAFDLTDVAVTADALHCHRATAEYIVGRGGPLRIHREERSTSSPESVESVALERDSRLVVDRWA